MLGNLLPVLGMAFLFGGWGRERQRFDRTAASAGGAQVAVAGGALLIPALLAATTRVTPARLHGLSVAVAVVLLLAYGAGLFFSLRTHAYLYTEEQEETLHGTPRWSVRRAVVVLLAATVGVAVLSELLVRGVTGVTEGLRWACSSSRRNRSVGAKRYAARGSGALSVVGCTWGSRDGDGVPVRWAAQAAVR